MLNPDDPPEVQIQKQARIIDALIKRANRQREVGPSAFSAFQSAIELQQKVAAQSRDLERAVTELESARYERKRTRRNLVEALSSMDEGFALFSDGELDLCNELFRQLLPDVAHLIRPGLVLERFVGLLAGSRFFVSSEKPIGDLAALTKEDSFQTVVELGGDRWFQLNVQRTSHENLVLLWTEITLLVRRNRDEKETLIDRQADYLQAVFQNMSPGVCTFSPDGAVMMHNVRFRDMLGLPDRLLETGTPLSRMLEHLAEQGHIGSGDGVRIDDWRRELRDQGWLRKRVRQGSARVFDIQATRLPDNGFVAEVKDVTLEARATELLENRVMERTAELTLANEKLTAQYDAQARVEEELRLAMERAEAAVSSKTRFLAAASHDLLQPINAAKLLISTMLERTRDTDIHPMMQRLDGAFGSAEQLLHSLLDISRLESPDPEAVQTTELCLAPIMEGVHADQSLFAEQKGVALDVVPCSAFVHSDPVYLLRSIQNLVVNAIQYTEPGGRVLVGCRRRAGQIVLEVWDTGIGIPSKDQERIFEEFARADNVALNTGMGLGLSVVDRACRVLGHSLSVRSAPGRGSVFSMSMAPVEGLSLPVADAGVPAPADDKQLSYIVMVIENDPGVLEGMVLWLEQWGASVLPVRSTDEALMHLGDMGIAPDIILADYQLDGGDTGVHAILCIREMMGEHVPAILITANRSKRLWQAGAKNDISVMAKPAKLTRLRALIDWKIQRELQVQSLPQVIPTKVAGDGAAHPPKVD